MIHIDLGPHDVFWLFLYYYGGRIVGAGTYELVKSAWKGWRRGWNE